MAKRDEIIEEKNKIPPVKVQEKVSIEKILVENFVSLQKVMTNLVVKFDNLSGQISKLLELFEISAKTLAEREPEKNENKEVVEKLNGLMEQNKIIAKGLILLHEKREEGVPEEMPAPNREVAPAPMPQIPPARVQIPQLGNRTIEKPVTEPLKNQQMRKIGV
ncbi:hypothetical protein M0R19_01245 [Candidatus Pacearchaeota archaeon]|nr:hypothetical protein [Candidatus Pacearchaeota archaeon]